MHRELNPHLFGPTQVPAQGWTDSQAQRSQAQSQVAVSAPSRVAYPPNELKTIEHHLTMLKVAINQIEKRSEGFNSKLEELGRGVHVRLERFSQAIIRLEDQQQKINQENIEKFAQIAAKVNERKVTDGKVQELIDRHNTIVRNFENRLTSLQRINAEQELTLHNAHAALEEVRTELGKRR